MSNRNFKITAVYQAKKMDVDWGKQTPKEVLRKRRNLKEEMTQKANCIRKASVICSRNKSSLKENIVLVLSFQINRVLSNYWQGRLIPHFTVFLWRNFH